jgi:chemotaxis protein methyltransferase CheR
MSATPKFVPPILTLAAANDFSAGLRQDTQGFLAIASLLFRLTGINMQPNDKNLSLMAGRLGPMLRLRGLPGYGALRTAIDAGDTDLAREVVAALTTHTTEFFRESAHFSLLTKLTPELLARAQREGGRDVRVWSAACSSGQELYSLAMTLSEAAPDTFPAGFKLLGTDVDLDVLERAAAGSYSENEMASVPPLYRQKYFREQRHAGGRSWQTKDAIAEVVRFAPLNLAETAYPFRFPFDVIFCRNVLIYFERGAAVAIVERLVRQLRPGGYLFLGHSETGALRSGSAESVATAVYRKKAQA